MMLNMVTRVVSVLGLLCVFITSATTTLVDFQVYPPVLTPYSPLGNDLVLADGAAVSAVGVVSDAKACVVNQTLMVHTFGQSYGQPFVGLFASLEGLQTTRESLLTCYRILYSTKVQIQQSHLQLDSDLGWTSV